jgi:hypothetical protein
VSHADAHAVARLPAISDTDEHIADVIHLVMEPDDERADPGLIRHGSDVFDRQRVTPVRAIFRFGHDRRRRVARLQRQVRREKHNAGSIVGAELDRRSVLEGLAFLRDGF